MLRAVGFTRRCAKQDGPSGSKGCFSAQCGPHSGPVNPGFVSLEIEVVRMSHYSLNIVENLH